MTSKSIMTDNTTDASGTSSTRTAASPLPASSAAHLFTQVRSTRSSAAAAAAAAMPPPAAAAADAPNSNRRNTKRKHVGVEYEQETKDASPDEDAEVEEVSFEEVSKGKKKKAAGLPADWKQVYMGIESMRVGGIARDAPVDTLGCERIANRSLAPSIFRFQTLVALMLSAQTKDAVTAQAIANLNQHWPDGLTVDNVIAADDATIDRLICKVGFHVRKAGYIRQTAAVCRSQYGGDIPATLEELIALPGVGPKMAHLTMQCAWNQVVGVGVDTHVHRICNRLGWVNSKTPEQTRTQLQDHLPRDYWGPINALLVGFGQKVCLPIGPKCRVCDVNGHCPEGRRALRYDQTPNKFHTLPPLQSIEQMKKQDAIIAQKVLDPHDDATPVKIEPAAAAAASSSPAAAAADVSGGVVTSRFFPIKCETSEHDRPLAASPRGEECPPIAPASPRVKSEPNEESPTLVKTEPI